MPQGLGVQEVYRVDAGRLSKARKTEQGGYVVDATVAYCSVNAYRQPDGSIRREYFPPEEAQKAGWLDSLGIAPVTHDHPGKVTRENWRQYAVGHAVGGTQRYDEKTLSNGVSLALQDDNEIAAVERGDSEECSVAHFCRIDPTPGISHDGRPYDVVQRDRRANHIGLREQRWARSRTADGKGAALNLDGAEGEVVYRVDGDGNQITTPQRSTAMQLVLDGKTYDLSDAGQVARLEVALAEQTKTTAAQAEALAAAKTATAELQAKHDGLVTELAAEKTKTTDLTARLDGIEVAATIEVAKTFAPKGDYSKAKTADEVKAAALLADPAKTYTLDGKTDDVAYVRAAFDIRKGQTLQAKADGGLAAIRTAGAPAPKTLTADGADGRAADTRSAYERNRERLHNRWKKPSTASKEV